MFKLRYLTQSILTYYSNATENNAKNTYQTEWRVLYFVVVNKGYSVRKNSLWSCGTILSLSKSQRYQFVKPSGTKQNFGLDGCNADLTIGKGKVVHEYTKSDLFSLRKKA